MKGVDVIDVNVEVWRKLICRPSQEKCNFIKTIELLTHVNNEQTHNLLLSTLSLSCQQILFCDKTIWEIYVFYDICTILAPSPTRRPLILTYRVF